MQNKLIIGFDYGSKYIGVAIGQKTTNTSRALECLVLKNKKINWEQIDLLIKTWDPGSIIVGIPLTMDNQIQNTTIEALNFLKKLQNRFKLPIYKIDERLSTWEAKKYLTIQNNYKLTTSEIKKVNSYAAMILVQQWLNENV